MEVGRLTHWQPGNPEQEGIPGARLMAHWIEQRLIQPSFGELMPEFLRS